MVAQKRSTGHHKKRQGLHQRRSKNFLRVYTPYLPLLVIMGCNIFFGAFWHAAPNSSTGGPKSSVLAYATDMSVSGLLDYTNQARNSNGEASLNLNSKLDNAAQAKANDMIARNYWSHNTPDGNPPWVFITNAGYSYNTAGENLAYGFLTSADTVNGWMNSPEHRANILNSGFVDVGFGFANGSNYNNSGQETVVVAMYASPYVPPAPTPPAATATPKAAAPAAPVSHASTTPAAPVASSTPAPAAQTVTTHIVNITILDSKKKPVSGVTITLHSTPQTAVTDKNGKVSFSNVATGGHTIDVIAKGAKSTTSLNITATMATVTETISEPTTGASSTTASKVSSAQSVSRLDLLSPTNARWLTAVMLSIAIMGIAYLVVKHSVALHRYIRRGERYVLKHALFDVTLISFVGLCIIMSHAVGTIL